MKKYELKQLIFSATMRCHCGSGLAYPKNGEQPDENSIFKIASDWWCSKILLCEPGNGEEHDVYPFSMFEIKSENQPSANGCSTRPK